MKVSELILRLKELEKQEGDLEIFGIGHPGEYGCEIEESTLWVTNRPDFGERCCFLLGKVNGRNQLTQAFNQ